MKGMSARQSGGERRKRRKYYGLYFLASVVALYLILFLLEPAKTQESLEASGGLAVKVAPVLLLILLLMGIMNYFVKPKTVSKYVGQGSGLKGWLFAMSAGILSHGPIYVWYPLLKELRTQGMRSGLVAVFLYNRAIKIPLLPLMIYYFGVPFVAVLLFYMVLASFVQGKIVEMTERRPRGAL